MTVNKAKRQEAKDDSVRTLKTYLASLIYLRQEAIRDGLDVEAMRDGLDVVAKIMWNAIAAIEAWLRTGKESVDSSEILDSPLCHSLDFLLKWLALPPDRRRQVAQDIAQYETGTSSGEVVPCSRLRASKKIAN